MREEIKLPRIMGVVDKFGNKIDFPEMLKLTSARRGTQLSKPSPKVCKVRTMYFVLSASARS